MSTTIERRKAFIKVVPLSSQMEVQRERHQRTQGQENLPKEDETWPQRALIVSVFAPSTPHSAATSYGK